MPVLRLVRRQYGPWLRTVPSTVAGKAEFYCHLAGWAFIGLIAFIQSPGLTVADTKHDLTANPLGFLRGALSPWTDLFPLGQLQNQAYGYLFPQGAFFLLFSGFPDWITQRLWWWLVLGVGYSGMFRLGAKIEVGSPVSRSIGALTFALSPHTISTLGAISSETWPMLLTPWLLEPLLSRKLTPRNIAASVLAVALMGAVNATATAAACLPAAIVLLYRRAWLPFLVWSLGTVAVSAWWIGPLLILGHFSPPFTDYIESSFVTTRWLNLTEILRGTTSWAPFAENERVAGTLLATNSYFVLLTSAISALGLVGLTKIAGSRMWITLLLIGVAVLGVAHGPFGSEALALLDAPLAPLRNVHKFDVLVRLPISLGVMVAVHFVAQFNFRRKQQSFAALAIVSLIVFGSNSPALSGRLSPQGGFTAVPSYWAEAADWLNENGAGTRTMVLPATSFARQTWGWTRDEPLQPLLEVPWVVRDAVPLVPPEAIRGLDGIVAFPNVDALHRLGVGLVVVRHDLAQTSNADELEDYFSGIGLAEHRFGEVSIFEIDRTSSMSLTSDAPVVVAGGGESLALLDELNGPRAYALSSDSAQIVTDTPALSVRNYGSIYRAESAQLASLLEGVDVRNRVQNYPSEAQPVAVAQRGGRVTASSSASDATSFGGADDSRSVTAAVDGSLDTAWYPTPGKQEGQWIQLEPEERINNPELEFTAVGAPVVMTVEAGGVELHRMAQPNQPVSVSIPATEVESVRITLGASSAPAGITEAKIKDHPIERFVSVPESTNVQQFVFQRIFTDTALIRREFVVPQEMKFHIDAATCHEDAATPGPVSTDLEVDGVAVDCGDTVPLSPGAHTVSTTSKWITLTTPDFRLPPEPTAIADQVPASDVPQILNTHRAANPGLRATVGGTELEGVTIDAASQAFIVPPGVAGKVELSFAGDSLYRCSLFLGAGLAMIGVLVALAAILREPRGSQPYRSSNKGPVLLLTSTLFLIAGLPGVLSVLAGWLILRFTLIKNSHLAASGILLAGMWLAHAPWPSEVYAGDTWFTVFASCLSLVALCVRGRDSAATEQPDVR